METKQIIANHMAFRQEYLSDNLTESKVGEVTEVHISKENNRICSWSIPENLEKRYLTFSDLDILKGVSGTPDELYQMNAVTWNRKIEGLSDKFKSCHSDQLLAPRLA